MVEGAERYPSTGSNGFGLAHATLSSVNTAARTGQFPETKR